MKLDEDLVGCIYEAAFIPELWPSVIERIAEITGTFGGSIYTSGTGYSTIAASKNCQGHLEDMIALGWAERNIRAHKLLNQKHNGFVVDHDCCTVDEIENHPIYTEFLRPRGLGWTAATYIAAADDDFAIFSIDQLYEKGPIDPATVTYLNQLRPHIARASALATQVCRQQGSNALSHLDSLGIPALLISHDGKVRQTNSLFARISDEIHIGAQDKITLRDSRAHGLLKQILRRPDEDRVVQSVPVFTKANSAPVVLHVVPLRRQARDLFTSVEFIITVAALSKAREDLPALLSMLYDLTAAETRVVENLCLGESVKNISKKHKVSIETTRTHIKRILQKTNMTRQSELISRFSTLNFDIPSIQ